MRSGWYRSPLEVRIEYVVHPSPSVPLKRREIPPTNATASATTPVTAQGSVNGHRSVGDQTAGSPFNEKELNRKVVRNFSPTRGEVPYSAAKAGLIALTQGSAQEYGPEVRINAVSPGLIRTPMSEALFTEPTLLDPVRRATPLARCGTAEDVAAVILFLTSDLSRYMTGQNLVVDGGMGLPQAGIDEVLRSLLDRRARREHD